MATDQGKTSGMNTLAIVSDILHRPMPQVGHTTFRMPYTPVTFGTLAGAARGELFEPVRQTPIHDWATTRGAQFEDVGTWRRARHFPCAGEDMHAAVARECRAVRDGAGIFDATTLGKIEVVGPDAAEFLNRLYTGDFTRLAPGRCRYAVMLNEGGFVIDDGIVARLAYRPVSRHHDDRRRGKCVAPYGGLSADRVPGTSGLADFDHRAMGGDCRAGSVGARGDRVRCRGHRRRWRCRT